MQRLVLEAPGATVLPSDTRLCRDIPGTRGLPQHFLGLSPPAWHGDIGALLWGMAQR